MDTKHSGNARMSAYDRDLIEKMRRAGRSYSEISRQLDAKESTVRTYCCRHGLTDEALRSAAASVPVGLCPNCGKAVLSPPKQKPKRFCCDQCRMEWWANNRACLKRYANYNLRCAHCGRGFISYGNNKRKYCGRKCYFEARFGADHMSDRPASL